MSEKQFENFLAETLITWAQDNLQEGYRYQFQSPDSDNSQKLYNALNELSTSFVTVKGINIPLISAGAKSILLVLHNEDSTKGFSENFISYIRDVVAAQQGEIKSCALLVIHNSLLDTLINSAENIAQAGWVWHPNEIMEALKTLINPLDPSEKVSKCLLKHRFEQIIEDGATMFGFEELFKAMEDDGDLRFDEIGLINDPVLQNWEGPEGQINARLEKNKQLYEKLDYIAHNFPTNLEEKLGELDFSPTFVKKHFTDGEPDSWKKTLEFSECEQEKQKNKDNFLELEKEIVSDGLLYSRTKTDTKAGKRDKHLVYLLEETQTSFEIGFNFLGGKIERKECTTNDESGGELTISTPDNTGGKRSRVQVKGQYAGEVIFFNFRVKRDKTTETHNFRVAVLRKGEFLEDAFKYGYLVDPKNQKLILQTEETSLKIADIGSEFELQENGQIIENSEFGSVKFENLASESEHVEFIVKGHTSNLTFNIEAAVATDTLHLPLMLDQEKFSKLYQNDYFAVLNVAKTKVQLENQEVAPKGKRLTLLQWERELLEDECLYVDKYPENNIYIKDLKESYPSLADAYSEYFEYLNENGSLPSLSGWGPNCKSLVEKV